MKIYLRWIAVLPSAFVAYFLASFAVVAFNYVFKMIYDVGWTNAGLLFVQCAASSWAFVWYGTKVAPSYKTESALSLTVLYIAIIVAIAGYLLFLAFQTVETAKILITWKVVKFGISTVICVASSILSFVELKKLEKNKSSIESFYAKNN